MEKISITLPSGTVITGTPGTKELNDLLTTMGTPDIYYYSASSGPIAVSAMNPHHAQNAVIKMMEDTLGQLKAHKKSPSQFVEEFQALLTNETLLALIKRVTEAV